MAQPHPEESPARSGIMPENVFVVACAALVVGLLIGQAVGKRQGMTVNQVVLPESIANAAAEEASHAGELGGMDAATEAELKATAPKAPENIEEARAMAEQMGMADVDMLLDLARRKLGNHVNFLSVGLLEKAVELEPNRAEAWAMLGQAYVAVKMPEESAKAYRKYLELEPDGEHAAEARAAVQ